MKIGATFKKRWQLYECVGSQDYVNRSGYASKWMVLQSRCADCDALFQLMTTEGRLKRRDVNRRCEIHKHPGKSARRRSRREYDLEQFNLALGAI
jgi:hypothetical protein